MKNITLRKVGRETLIPANEATALHLSKIAENDLCEYKPVGVVRCPKLHGKFFAMLAGAHKNLPEEFGNMDYNNFRKSAIISAGYFEEVIVPIEGFLYTFRQAKSIAFAKMDQKEFEELYRAVHRTLCANYGMGEFEDFVMEFM